MIDGNTSEVRARNLIRGYVERDPAVLDMCPAPLSGKWDSGPTARSVLHAVGTYPEHGDGDEFLALYENMFSESRWAEVLRSCRYIAEDEAAEGVSA